MSSLIELYQRDKQFILDKSIRQILAFAGDGKLKNNNQTCLDLRDLLSCLPTEVLIQYADECLAEKFEDSGLVLQDIVNQAGWRLGFEVEYGLYQGSKNTVGYDGIWDLLGKPSLIIEVKTTDAYRINLDHIYNYKRRLVEQARISEDSSILIVVGRKDTGDLEAQIRGSRYGWDFRLISVDSLMKLVQIKANLTDEKTIRQISEILRPLEFTRLDKLIEIVFDTTQDVQLDINEFTFDSEDQQPTTDEKDFPERPSKVNFHTQCLEKVESYFKTSLVKINRAGYQTPNQSKGFIICTSKVHPQKNSFKYWFTFYPRQEIFLSSFTDSYIIYGCGNENNSFALPLSLMQRIKPFLSTTGQGDRIGYQIYVYEKYSRFYLKLSKNQPIVDLGPYRIP